MGAYVIAVAGPTNQQFCRDLGADEVINYKEETFEAEKDIYDVVYDVIGRSSAKKCAMSLKPKGRYITTIPRPSTLIGSLVSKLTSWIPVGKQLKSQLILVKPKGDDLAAMAELMVRGTIKSVIDTAYPLANIEDALAKSQTWRTRGKLVILLT